MDQRALIVSALVNSGAPCKCILLSNLVGLKLVHQWPPQSSLVFLLFAFIEKDEGDGEEGGLPLLPGLDLRSAYRELRRSLHRIHRKGFHHFTTNLRYGRVGLAASLSLFVPMIFDVLVRPKCSLTCC